MDDHKCAYAIFILLIFILLLDNSRVCAQNVHTEDDSISTKNCEQQDLRDLFRKKNKAPKAPRKTMLLILPSIASNPANGFMVGMGGSAGWHWGPKSSTRVSSATFNAVVTTQRQLITFIKSSVYTTSNELYLQGDWRYYIYKAPTWGLGTNSPDTINVNTTFAWQGSDIEETDGAYPMSYDYIRFHEIINFKIYENIYAGPGYHLDHYYKIVDEFLDTTSIPLELTPHFVYSEINGFNPKKYTLSGISANIVFDSRDNLMNPYKGYYANINYRYNPTFLGSNQNSSSLYLEFRAYVGLSKKTPRHLIAFWTFGNFLISGEQPYLTLMANGEDQKGRSGRGYVAGRYRGENFLYGEVEYRFPITTCSKLLGGVIFANVSSASNQTRDIPLLEYLRPAVGFGFRIMVNKHFRTNVNIDFGFGQESNGLYFSGTETF